ncbi:MAG TPA: STAUR_1299 family protein [Verrucomicrobiae bacterium]|jgi:hypothetical protein
MADFRDAFIARAFQVVPGVDYNRARRDLLERADIVPVIYEVTLPEQGSWETFRDREFPLFVRYLKSQGIDPEYPRMLVVAVFFRDRCYFIEGVEWIKALRELEDLNSEALHFRVLRWLTETEPR